MGINYNIQWLQKLSRTNKEKKKKKKEKNTLWIKQIYQESNPSLIHNTQPAIFLFILSLNHKIKYCHS